MNAALMERPVTRTAASPRTTGLGEAEGRVESRPRRPRAADHLASIVIVVHILVLLILASTAVPGVSSTSGVVRLAGPLVAAAAIAFCLTAHASKARK